MHPILVLKTASSTCARALLFVALTLMGWVPLAGLLLALNGCSTAPNKPAAVKLPTARSAALTGIGPAVSGAANFDAPVIDSAAWTGAPIGTGQFSIPLTPALAGGPAAIASTEVSPRSTLYYLLVGDLSSPNGTALAIISDAPFAVGTTAIDPAHHFVAVFDTVTGNPVAEAQSGTLTVTAAGTTLGSHVTGTLSATFQAVVAPAPACTSSSQCAAGEVCMSGACVVSPVCTSSAQCASGEVCVGGACVAAPACTTNAQCASGEVCLRGTCVPSTGCTTNAQCAAGEVCVSGTCVAAPACTSSAQCAPGQACVSGRCVGTTPAGCQGMQGQGTVTSSQGAVATCSALGAPSVNLTNALAAVTDSSSGTPAIILVDAATQSEGLELALNACPAGPGTLTLGAGFEATLYTGNRTVGHVSLFAAYQATGGTLTFTQVGTTLAGTASLSFDNGGTASASFLVQ
jgi:Cys-rich repeat protein